MYVIINIYKGNKIYFLIEIQVAGSLIQELLFSFTAITTEDKVGRNPHQVIYYEYLNVLRNQ
jgi:hypothetical protein